MIVATASDQTTAATFVAAEPHDSGARAALYGVISNLFFAAPSKSLLQQIAAARNAVEDDASLLASTWRDLCDAAASADPEAIRSEFDEAFVTTGRPPVSLYASSYMSGRLRGQLLAELRDDLARIGFARVEQSSEYEDHLAALCDVMRGLITDEDSAPNAHASQQLFFLNYLAPWYGRVCSAIDTAGQTFFYRSVAKFTDAFFANESEYFELA